VGFLPDPPTIRINPCHGSIWYFGLASRHRARTLEGGNEMELFSQEGLAFLTRWLHVLAGITWIGLLYYFNVVQVPAFAAYGDEGKARNISIDKLARRALWWFRWAAVVTLVLGLLIIGVTENYMQDFMSETSGSGRTRRSCWPTPPT